MNEEPPAPYRIPKQPFYVDDDGDVCDREGWLVVVPAYDVWPDRKAVSDVVCRSLNEEPIITKHGLFLRDKNLEEMLAVLITGFVIGISLF